MRRSKFEICLNVLETLTLEGPMRINKITCKTNLNYVYLKEVMNDLRQRRLVEERKMNNSFTYAATSKAILVLSQFKEVRQSLPFLNDTLAV
ncbi:MAG: winged helix-turn-helix domain-containing protein [Candidatus Bathyarchaeia archaeon]